MADSGVRRSEVAAELEAWFLRQTPPVAIPGEGQGRRDLHLVDAGLVDSFLVVMLVEHIEQRYGVHVPDDSIAVERLATINRIADLVLELAEER